MNVNHLKIATRLALGFGIVLALMAVMTAVVFMRLDYLDGRTQYLATLQQRAAMSSEWRAQAELNVSRVLAIAKSGGSSVLADYFGPQMRTTSERITELQKTMTDAVDTEQGKALVAAIAAQRNKYADVREQVLEHFARGDGAGGEALLTKDMMPAAQAYVASIEKLAGFQTRLVVEGMEEARTSVLATEALLIALLLVGLVAGGGAAWLITRSITRPLRATVQATDRIAAGDLTGDVRAEGSDEMAAMQRSLAQMQDALRRLVSEVRAGSDSIATASAQIASGNQDLSSRTEQTSSSLQQAASSLEEITGTVAQTADSARTANQLAASASAAAGRGGQVVAQVVSTMDEINGSSRRIADIIGTIDGIAFQTNILALNAAVEAARAGEQGRGFAVVAGEVRSLAQRSAEAAREIKGLIQSSVEKVDAGSRLVQDAGAVMGDIVSGVQRVTDVIGEISAATSEQSAGLRQVNEAVAGLDQMTQQNAALVEESAAAAESLAEQSRKLSGVVGTFRLHGHAPASATSAAPARPAAAPTGSSSNAKPKTLAQAAVAKARRPQAAASTAAGRSGGASSKQPGLPAASVPAALPPAAPTKATSAADRDWETF